MWGWVGELADAFGKAGFPGLVVLALLIIVALMVKANNDKSKMMVKMHESTLQVVENSSNSHLAVAKVLSRIEAILGLSGDEK